jgi:20S proteasome alpha/beta subunit
VTLIVGVLCRDGVVMASDSAATYAASGMHTIGQQSMTKVRALGNSVLYASTGAVGMSQIIADGIESQWAAMRKSNPSPEQVMVTISKDIYERCKHLFHSASMLAQAGVRHAPAEVSCRSLVAVPVLNKPCLFQFGETGAPEQVTEQLCCVALGSGQPIADPFMAFMKKILWPDCPPTLAEARLVAAWTVQHVVQTNPGGVAGDAQIATLVVRGNQPKIETVNANEHYEQIKDLEDRLRKHILHPGPAADTVVPVPKSSSTVTEPTPVPADGVGGG